MTSVRTPFKALLLAGLLAGASHAALAQTPPPPPAAGHAAMGPRDPAKIQARMVQHQAELKAKLKLSASQEGAWTSFIAAMQPPALMPRPDHAEMDKLSTPERIDKMRAMRAARDAEVDKRMDATKTFYAALTPEQQKIFDTSRMPHGEHGGPAGPGAHRMPKG